MRSPKTSEQLKLFTKRCCDCGEVKSTEHFHYCGRAPDRAQYRCRECRAKFDHERHEAEMLTLKEVITSDVDMTKLLTNWKPPIVSVTLVEVVPSQREAVSVSVG